MPLQVSVEQSVQADTQALAGVVVLADIQANPVSVEDRVLVEKVEVLVQMARLVLVEARENLDSVDQVDTQALVDLVVILDTVALVEQVEVLVIVDIQDSVVKVE